MILLCYDGSEDARAATEHAGDLLRGQRATVLTVWADSERSAGDSGRLRRLVRS